jgi:hypothetical protein
MLCGIYPVRRPVNGRQSGGCPSDWSELAGMVAMASLIDQCILTTSDIGARADQPDLDQRLSGR